MVKLVLAIVGFVAVTVGALLVRSSDVADLELRNPAMFVRFVTDATNSRSARAGVALLNAGVWLFAVVATVGIVIQLTSR